MFRFRLATRISITVVVALLAVWLASLGLAYWWRADRIQSAFPQPARIAAIAELAEHTTTTQRDNLFAAIRAPVLDIRIENGPVPSRSGAVCHGVAEAVCGSYAAALDGRFLSLSPRPISPLNRRFPNLFGSAVNALDFHIALRSGDWLVIDTTAPVPVTRLGLPVGFGAGLLGTLVALAALIVMHRETRPLVHLAQAADRMDLSGVPVLLPPSRSSAPEIRSLIDAFGRLQTRLSQLLRARMAMLGGISHDVRTFATRLRLRIETMPDSPERDRAVADIADMIRLLDDALLTSRAGAGELTEELVEIDELVRTEIADRCSAGAEVTLRVEPHALGVAVLGDRIALRRIFCNLLDNALKYGYAAHLVVTADGGSISVIVDDEGTGIPPDLREILFEPFVRAESSRSRATGGAGLGLAVVRNLVEAHHGSLTVEDAPSGGARFKVTLPCFVVA
ncbi:sensor histidine kinase [Consotaella salsifontis]|uniref:histidine kinase n=1 Tax=Consotaella salsifontis TaxID=1365950 RepID=A0A1T4TAC7_9HYPH|nr:HAMP domain-containing sensor histidine kinase [Consotaella salsifontis]SKA37337.1 Signal transduction histidine kinase [Consotaella salsifontis]